ncbi:hypothetical protein LCGC14_0176120 [marine sediment metagenome]|uniref:Uncharacterized protein n=1 Tax=marine sediment metagenome TaxID=412755 RepID=A0A0F9XTV9_9ZZZZ
MQKTKLTGSLVIGLFIFGLFMAPTVSSGEALVNAADDRSLFKSADLLAKYSYNATDISGTGEMSFGMGGFNIHTTNVDRANESIGDLGVSKGATADGRPSDFNITGGIGMSSSLYNDLVDTPKGFETASRLGTSRDIGQMEDTQLSTFGEDGAFQYFGYESLKMEEIEAEIGQSWDNDWGVADIDITAIYLRYQLDLTIAQAIVNDIIGHEDYQDSETTAMTETELANVIEETLPEHLGGILLGYANLTELNEASGKSTFTATTEIADTFDDSNVNDTDNTLTSFETGTTFMTLALISYLMEIGVETLDATAALLTPGDFIVLDNVGRGNFVGARLVYGENGAEVEVAQDTSSILATTANLTRGYVATIFSWFGYEVPPDVIPWIPLFLLFVFINLFTTWAMGMIVKDHAKGSWRKGNIEAYYEWVGKKGSNMFTLLINWGLPIWMLAAYFF